MCHGADTENPDLLELTFPDALTSRRFEATLLGQATVASGLEPTHCVMRHKCSISCRFEASLLGQATVASGLDPPDALLLAGDLALARRRLNTESALHAMFLLTDVREKIDKVDWGTVYRVLLGLKVRCAFPACIPGICPVSLSCL